jgi:hypothetical protein
MRPNLESQRVMLDKTAEHEHLLPILGRIAADKSNATRASHIGAFCAYVERTNDAEDKNRSFSISPEEAEMLLRRLHDPEYLHQLVDEGVIQDELSPRQLQRYAFELGSNVGQIYANSASQFAASHPRT